ncbi:M48 family metallopeptidase [Pontiella agarivorans]|uniref:M48 family metallopeptidase n=1 Tax=Pontiella agarivorans TaxID=3038953 RepID=A0ABU5MUS4_9BACT|nr:M48 family metallopeptidase [Pontiella agarivorans]MDZ8117898.1 M48 family metallopeptidase [Pontiella agarivorans]
MKKLQSIFGALALFVFVSGCSTVPITGRKQLSLVSDAQLIPESAASYEQVITEGPLSENKEQTEMIQRVGARISAAVEQYFAERNQSDVVAGFDWEFNLIEEDVPNAWCMPGGKVAFYTGILPYTQDETGVAVVMGHEVAHAIARHSNERVSHQMAVAGGSVLTAWMAKDSEYEEAILAAYGIGTQLGGILPYSRLHESEADHMGLIFMAMAGYNPEAAVDFWQRMAEAGGEKPPEFLSTHPSDETRVRQIREHLPEAMQYYRPSP